MLLHEIFSLFKSLDNLLSEGFKDDMYNQYPEAKDNDEVNKAIKTFNTNNKIKDAVKKKINVNGNIAKSIKNVYSTADKFVKFINTVSKELTTKEQEREEYKQLKQGTASMGETDYWLIPCHTFKEAHAAASRYTGDLPRLSKEEITNKYGINTPKQATFYRTGKTPADFLEYLKNEDRFFVAPSWCVAADERYFNVRYNLKTKPDEKAKCYIVISKKYPNVRFCVVLDDSCSAATLKDGLVYQKAKIKELRDPWQIGADNEVVAGKEMMKAAFGENEAKKILQKISDMGSMKLSDAVNGKIDV